STCARTVWLSWRCALPGRYEVGRPRSAWQGPELGGRCCVVSGQVCRACSSLQVVDAVVGAGATVLVVGGWAVAQLGVVAAVLVAGLQEALPLELGGHGLDDVVALPLTVLVGPVLVDAGDDHTEWCVFGLGHQNPSRAAHEAGSVVSSSNKRTNRISTCSAGLGGHSAVRRCSHGRSVMLWLRLANQSSTI